MSPRLETQTPRDEGEHDSPAAAIPVVNAPCSYDGVLAALDEIGYEGWLVVEQDMLPESNTPVQRATDEQRRNREYLHARGI